MTWATLLHFYQPQGQKKAIIDAITEQCYRPLAQGVLDAPEARLNVNFTGVLLDQLHQYGHQDVIDMWAECARRGQVELVGSAKYHVILPLLPAAEARRQIQINDATNQKYFGSVYQRKGIFLPELAWSPELAPMLGELGFEWAMLDELAYSGRVNEVDYTQTYKQAGTDLGLFFREHRLSATIMSAAPRDVARLKDAARHEATPGRYIITAMDGETFGHHRVGHEQLLFNMFTDPEIELIKLSDIAGRFPQRAAVKTVACTWASSEDDLAKGIPFISWNDPANGIHRLQWKLLNLAVDVRDPEEGEELDAAVSSDQFFWAAARPWWMIEHIERGAFDLKQTIVQSGRATPEQVKIAHELYHQILDTAYHWQRTGKINRMHKDRAEHVRIPYKEHTLEKNDEAPWQAIIDLMKTQEQAARDRTDYEEAILWRNAVYKLEHKLDIYDGWYVIDLLRTRLPEGTIEQTMTKYRAKFDRIRGGQVEQRSN